MIAMSGITSRDAVPNPIGKKSAELPMKDTRTKKSSPSRMLRAFFAHPISLGAFSSSSLSPSATFRSLPPNFLIPRRLK